MRRGTFPAAILLLALAGGQATATTIPSEVKETVTFIFVRNPTGVLIPNGTAFFVGVKDEQNPARSFVYLVTAKHVIQDETRKSYYPFVWVRLNKRGGGAEMIKIPLRGNGAFPVYVDKNDPNTDLAVLPLLPKEDVYDFKFLSDEMLTTRERFKQANIKEGDDVFFTGLFGHFFGDPKHYPHRNYPVVRFGRVALVTDEKIPWKERENEQTKLLDLYLIEAQSYGGNSGSPVFFYLGAMREPGVLLAGYQLLLAGVMKGFFVDAMPLGVAKTGLVPFSRQNVGIAAVVPSYKLYEILFSSELRAIRAKSQ